MLPTPTNIADVRVAAGLTQCQAAEMVGLAHALRWSEYERGVSHIDKPRWELFLIKVGRHLLYGPRPGVEAPNLDVTARENPTVAQERSIVLPKDRADYNRAWNRLVREREHKARERAKQKAKARTKARAKTEAKAKAAEAVRTAPVPASKPRKPRPPARRAASATRQSRDR
jgi:hypothetical protein